MGDAEQDRPAVPLAFGDDGIRLAKFQLERRALRGTGSSSTGVVWADAVTSSSVEMAAAMAAWRGEFMLQVS